MQERRIWYLVLMSILTVGVFSSLGDRLPDFRDCVMVGEVKLELEYEFTYPSRYVFMKIASKETLRFVSDHTREFVIYALANLKSKRSNFVFYFGPVLQTATIHVSIL